MATVCSWLLTDGAPDIKATRGVEPHIRMTCQYRLLPGCTCPAPHIPPHPKREPPCRKGRGGPAGGVGVGTPEGAPRRLQAPPRRQSRQRGACPDEVLTLPWGGPAGWPRRRSAQSNPPKPRARTQPKRGGGCTFVKSVVEWRSLVRSLVLIRWQRGYDEPAPEHRACRLPQFLFCHVRDTLNICKVQADECRIKRATLPSTESPFKKPKRHRRTRKPQGRNI